MKSLEKVKDQYTLDSSVEWIKHAKWVKLEVWTKFDIFAELNFNLHFMCMLFLVCNHVIRQPLVEKNNSQNFARCQQRVACYRCSDCGDCARSLHRQYLDKKRVLPREIYLLLLRRLDGSRKTARVLGKGARVPSSLLPSLSPSFSRPLFALHSTFWTHGTG